MTNHQQIYNLVKETKTMSAKFCKFGWLIQLCPTQMAYWGKKYVTILTRAAYWMTYLWATHWMTSLISEN